MRRTDIDWVAARRDLVSPIKRALRRPLKARVQGADRREWWSPFQGLEPSNRTLSGFAEGFFRQPASLSRLHVRFI